MTTLGFAILGTGFWAHYQLAGWRELSGLECVALYNRTYSKADALARKFNIQNVYASPEELLEKEHLDFIDIITDVGTHASLTRLAAAHGVNVVCQ
jgi:D-apiose dehydrogenase